MDKRYIGSWFPKNLKIETLQDEMDTWVFLVQVGRGHKVKMSFFGDIATGRVGEPSVTDDGVICVASALDLLAHKLKVILQRAERKDYEDIATLLRSGLSLTDGLAAAKTLFRDTYQPSETLRALSFFEDGDLPSLGAEIRKTLISAARNISSLPKMDLLSENLIS